MYPKRRLDIENDVAQSATAKGGKRPEHDNAKDVHAIPAGGDADQSQVINHKLK
jgi:hypothetical protein